MPICIWMSPARPRACCAPRSRPAIPSTAAAWCFHSGPVQTLELARAAIGPGGRRCGADRALPALSHLSSAARCRKLPTATRQHRGLERRCAWRSTRRLYQEKFDRVLPILSDVLELSRPEGGFYLWPDIDGDDAQFTRALYERSSHMIILPGSYLARDANGAKIREPVEYASRSCRRCNSASKQPNVCGLSSPAASPRVGR